MESNDTLCMSSSAQRWAKDAILSIHAQLSDEINNYRQSSCDYELLAKLCQAASASTPKEEAVHALNYLEAKSAEHVRSHSVSGSVVPSRLRQLYTDCRLLHSLVDLQTPTCIHAEDQWENAVRRLDMAIIVAGTPGEGRLDLVLDTIQIIQTEHLPMPRYPQHSVNQVFTEDGPSSDSSQIMNTALAPNAISRISPPSFTAFCRAQCTSPFILSGFIQDWPAILERKWNSPFYLCRIAGRGRVVPVEVGSDYRAEEWGQELVPWEDFLRAIGMNIDSEPSVYSKESSHSEPEPVNGHTGKQVLYLAQHTLLTQFPALRSDIIVPDYVYASLPPPSTYPAYRPPGNDEQLIINAWLGPKGTVSPAHTDPYFNFYAQVVGRKTVWLAPPQFQDAMYPFAALHAPHVARNEATSATDRDDVGDTQKSGSLLANTSRVDVFAPPDAVQFPYFESHVRPHAMCAVLEPGDLLYIPPGYWHAMQSEDISFSVSMWF